MKLNRKIAPAIQIDSIEYPSIKISDQLHYIQGTTQEYTFLQLVFNAGKVQSTQKLIADCCCDMLLSGTKTKNAFELNELLDYYGASVEPILGDDDLTIRIYCLNKQLPNILPLIHEVLSESIFPEDEAAIILAKWKQRQQINLKKTDYLANRKFRNVLFGSEHPYGMLVAQSDFDQVNIEDIRLFYKDFIKNKRCTIILTGKLEDNLIKAIQTTFSNQVDPVDATKVSSSHSSAVQITNEAMDTAVQASIRMGKLVCTMDEPDYMGLYILTTILGGYFSSRLMTNLREDKGYTYGIYATIYSKEHAGVLEISAEVNNEFKQLAIDEIKNEILRLINEPILEDELEKVKNYLLGQMMRSIDGPIKTGKIYKTLLMQKLNFNFSKKFEQYIKDVDTGELNRLARVYYQLETMYIVCIG